MTTVQSSTTVDPALLATMNGTTAATNSTQDAQNRFLKLLVTQMQNQDPMNPMDNAQITSQLAQLSTVTGIDKLNASVNSLSASLLSSQSLQAANMIGHGVMSAGNTINLSSGKGVYGVSMTQPVDSAQVTILNASGVPVRTLDVGALSSGVNALTWDGTTDAGAVAPDGQYTFKVAAKSAGTAVTATTLGFGLVNSISASSSGVKLEVANVGEIGLSDVQQIY